jgi:tRNA(Arg) A34 adenosine deaminase TadA
MPSTDAKESLSQSPGWLAALEEARQGFSEGGLPIGACVVSESGKILGRGHNMLVQNGTPQMHVRFVLKMSSPPLLLFLILARPALSPALHKLSRNPPNSRYSCPRPFTPTKKTNFPPPLKQGEMAALASCGRLHAAEFRGATMFTTLSPCAMCTGAILLYGFGRVVIGEAEAESKQKGMGGEDYLRSKGVEIVDMGNSECKEMMRRFVEAKLELCRTEPWFVDE